jgi:hypothetical protein
LGKKKLATFEPPVTGSSRTTTTTTTTTSGGGDSGGSGDANNKQSSRRNRSDADKLTELQRKRDALRTVRDIMRGF